MTAEEVLTILQRQRVKVLPSKRTIQKHLARVDGKTRYEKKLRGAKEVVELPLAGGVAALTDEVATAGAASGVCRLLPTCGRRRRRQKGRVPSWPRFVHERKETLLPKPAAGHPMAQERWGDGGLYVPRE